MNKENWNKIYEWCDHAIKKESWKKYDNLDIDIIDKMYENRTYWISSGLECLKTAIEVRDLIDKNFILALGFSLKSESKALGLNFKYLSEFQEELDDSPPSLYLFHPEWDDWLEIKKNSKSINLFSEMNIDGMDILFLEFKSKHDFDYRRSVFFVVK